MGRHTILGVTGCMAQRLGPESARPCEPRQSGRWARWVPRTPGADRAGAGGHQSVETQFDASEHYEDFRPRRLPGVKAWIPVQRGCDYRCTYCIVPTTRGPERSRALPDVVREIQSPSPMG